MTFLNPYHTSLFLSNSLFLLESLTRNDFFSFLKHSVDFFLDFKQSIYCYELTMFSRILINLDSQN